MSPRKLTAADKKAIVSSYRSSPESNTVLADRYGVSSSTISRLLKTNIPEDEYEVLISEKRGQKGGESADEFALEVVAGVDVAADFDEAIGACAVVLRPRKSLQRKKRSPWCPNR
jgi:hypothetical protein